MKTQRLREKMLAEVKHSKQTTLDSLPASQQKSPQAIESSSKKQIIITEIGTETAEDELTVKIVFRLLPSKASFSKITLDLFFDGHKMYDVPICIPQGSLAKDEFEFPLVLDMRGIGAGLHVIKVEMFELWASAEKLTFANKEVTIDYVPVKRTDRLIAVPMVKRAAGQDLIVVSDSEREMYHQMDENVKKEQTCQRDAW